MTVRELIAKLSEYPDDYTVLIGSFNTALEMVEYNDVDDISEYLEEDSIGFSTNAVEILY